MHDKKIRKLIYAALMAALTCVATLVIQIPAPAGGYVNLGDCVVLLAGWLLGPWYGAAAAGIGSMLADLLGGFAIYAPATLILKALMAVVTGLLHRKPVSTLLGGVAAEFLMVVGYLLYGAVVTGSFAASLLGVPGNATQGVVCLVLALLLRAVLKKTPLWATL